MNHQFEGLITSDQIPLVLTNLFSKVENIETYLKNSFSNYSQEDKDKPLNIEQAASFLDLKVSTVYGKVFRKELPYHKRGRRVYFLKSDLINYLKAGRVKTEKEIEEEAFDSLKCNI